MIVDNIKNASTYINVHPEFKKVFEFLEKSLTSDLEVKRYDINGNTSYALVQSYTTVPTDKQKWEAHRKYIDVQFMIEGTELFGYSKLDNMINPTEYNQEKDCILSETAKDAAMVKLSKGDFAIVWPQDAHQPRCTADTECNVKKIVVKVAVTY